MTFLTRYRVFLGFVFAAVTLWLARPTRESFMIGAAIMIAGECFRIWAAGHLEKSKEVTRSGPYRFTRHPLYLGSSLMAAGFAIATRHPVAGVMTAVYVVLMFSAAILSEEAHLREKFGDEYSAYAEKRAAPMQRTFSWRRAMGNREYNAIAGVAAVLMVLAAKLYFLT